MLKFATAVILESTMIPANVGNQRLARLRRQALRHEFKYDVRPGFLYVRSRAISSRTNDNYDEFPAEEIERGYKTFIGKPVFVNHHNDDHKRARGVVIDAVLHKHTLADGSPDTWVEVLMEVDAVRFPKLAKAIVEGRIDRTSMGCDVAYSVCSVPSCRNKATSPSEYCQHIPRMKGKKLILRNAATGARESHLIRETCFPDGTPVLLSDGSSAPIETIRPGDEVIDHLGQPRRVEQRMSRQHVEPLVVLSHAGHWRPLRVTAEHPILAIRRRDSRNGQKPYTRSALESGRLAPEFVVAGDLMPGDFVAEVVPSLAGSLVKLVVADWQIPNPDRSRPHPERIVPDRYYTPQRSWRGRQHILRACRSCGTEMDLYPSESDRLYCSSQCWGDGYARGNSAHSGSEATSIPDTVEMNYDFGRWVGWFLAEGSISWQSGRRSVRGVTFGLHRSETAHAQEIVDLGKRLFGLTGRIRLSSGSNSQAVEFSSAELAKFMRCLGDDCYVKALPDEWIDAPVSFIEGVASAHSEGDGEHHGGRTGGRIDSMVRTHATSSPRLADQMYLLRLMLGHNPTAKTPDPVGSGKRTVPGHHVRSYLDRDARQHISWGPWVFTRIKEVAREPFSGVVHNLEVSGTHTYTANGLAVHNCYGLSFFENSLLVEPPADPTAAFTGVDDRGLKMAASKTASTDGDGLEQHVEECGTIHWPRTRGSDGKVYVGGPNALGDSDCGHPACPYRQCQHEWCVKNEPEHTVAEHDMAPPGHLDPYSDESREAEKRMQEAFGGREDIADGVDLLDTYHQGPTKHSSLEKTSQWYYNRSHGFGDPIVHAAGTPLPKGKPGLDVGDTVLFPSGHSAKVNAVSRNLLLLEGHSGPMHRGPIEGDYSKSIWSSDSIDEAGKDVPMASDQAKDFLDSNPTGPTKFSSKTASTEDCSCGTEGLPAKHTDDEHWEWEKSLPCENCRLHEQPHTTGEHFDLNEAKGLDAWGRPKRQPYDGHGAFDCNNHDCAEHPAKMYENGLGMPGWMQHDLASPEEKDLRRQIGQHFMETGQHEDAQWLLHQQPQGPSRYSSLTQFVAEHLEPHDIARALDKASDDLGEKHQDDLTYVPDWEPLRKAVPAHELDGWMFMNRVSHHPDTHVANVVHDPALGKTWKEMEPYFRGPAHREGQVEMEPPKGLVQYKHGITRKGLMLDEHGQAWRTVHKPGHNGLGQGMALMGPHHPSSVLKDHYQDLADWGHSPETKYDDDFIADRNKKLQDAGYQVVMGQTPHQGSLVQHFAGSNKIEKGTPEYKGHYNRGWGAGRRGSGLGAADDRGEPDAWYDGYMDAATDRPKWSLMYHPHAEAANAALDAGWTPPGRSQKTSSTGEQASLWPTHPLYRVGDRVMQDITGGSMKGQTRSGIVREVFPAKDPGGHHRINVEEEGPRADRYHPGSSQGESAWRPHDEASPEQMEHYHSQQAKNERGEPYIPEDERNLDLSKRTVVHHLTDRHDFAPDPTHHPHNNTTMGGNLSPRLFVGNPSYWANHPNYGYRRPYVAEVDVPAATVQNRRGYGGEREIPGRYFEHARVNRVLPYHEYEREQDEPGYRSSVDTRTWTPEQHREHLKNWREHLHENHGWGWNEFDENHNHVGLGDEDWDENMHDPNTGYPGTYVRRDRNGEVMRRARSSLTQAFASGFGTGDGDSWVTCSQGHRHWGANGAAGLLIRHTDDRGNRTYLLQHRAPWVDGGDTWGIPAGALHHGEDPMEGAMREAREELGGVPHGLRHVDSHTDDHGGWTFTTHLMESPSKWGSSGGEDAAHEVGEGGVQWVHEDEVGNMDLHPGFAKTWPKLKTHGKGLDKEAVGGPNDGEEYDDDQPHRGKQPIGHCGYCKVPLFNDAGEDIFGQTGCPTQPIDEHNPPPVAPRHWLAYGPPTMTSWSVRKEASERETHCPECGEEYAPDTVGHVHFSPEQQDAYRALWQAGEMRSQMAQHADRRPVDLSDPHDLKQHMMESHGYGDMDFWRTSHDEDHPALDPHGFDDADRPLHHHEVRRLHDWEHGHGIENDHPDYDGGIPGHFLGDSHFHTATRKQATWIGDHLDEPTLFWRAPKSKKWEVHIHNQMPDRELREGYGAKPTQQVHLLHADQKSDRMAPGYRGANPGAWHVKKHPYPGSGHEFQFTQNAWGAGPGHIPPHVMSQVRKAMETVDQHAQNHADLYGQMAEQEDIRRDLARVPHDMAAEEKGRRMFRNLIRPNDQVACPKCDGEGKTEEGYPCVHCNGTGDIKREASRADDDDPSGLKRGFDKMFDDIGKSEGFENWDHFNRHSRDTKTMADLMHRYEGGPQHPLHPGRFDADDHERPGDKEGLPYYEVEDPAGSGWTARDYGGPDIHIYHRATPNESHDLIDAHDETDPEGYGNLLRPGHKHPGFGHEELHQELQHWVHGDPEETGGTAQYLSGEHGDPRIRRWQRRNGYQV